jgi:hypothetical protein
MSLSDLITPVVADQLAAFGPGEGGAAARLNYSVPLPGAYSWNRVVPLELPADWFTTDARAAGDSLIELGVVQGDQGHLVSIDKERLAHFYRRVLPATARPSLRLVGEVGGEIEPLLNQVMPRVAATETETRSGLLDRRAVLAEPDDVLRQRIRLDSYLDRLAEREAVAPATDRVQAVLSLPTAGVGASVRPVPIDPVAPVMTRLAIVETWELRAFLGDYGLGRTLQTFSLLPGERTMITVETWRSDSASREDASSIFDSSDVAAQTRFTSSVANQTGSAFQDQGGWALSVATSASASGKFFDVVDASASFSAGFAANHQESSQRWSSSVSQAASEHAAQVNNSRQQAVQTSSNSTSASGASTSTVRELSNTNLRRVLNFVFRELNQKYETYVVLKDIKVAFYNGNPGSAEIVPLADIGKLLRKHVVPARQADAARQLLGFCAERIDANGARVSTLQVATKPNGAMYTWAPATLDSKVGVAFEGDPLSNDVRWRFAPGELSKDSRSVRGVVMNKSDIVLRTDNMVVEALLGQADALDPYASALQALDLERRASEIDERNAETKRTTDALELVSAQASDQRIDAWQKIFPDQPEIEVVPAAAVSNGDKNE